MQYRSLSPKEVARFLLAVSLVSYGMAIHRFFQPRVPDGSGRWGWLDQLFFQLFGLQGQFVMWAVLGTILLVSYFNQRNKKSDQ